MVSWRCLRAQATVPPGCTVQDLAPLLAKLRLRRQRLTGPFTSRAAETEAEPATLAIVEFDVLNEKNMHYKLHVEKLRRYAM